MLEIWGASDSRNSSVKRCGFVLENLSVGLSKTNPTCPDDLTREKHFSKFSSLPLLLNYKQKLFFRNLAENLMAGLSKLPSTVSESLKEKDFSPEIILLINFWLWVDDFRGPGQKFGRFTNTALYVSRGAFPREKFFESKSFFSISLWLWSDDFHYFGEKCRKCHQSCILPVQTNILPKNGLEKKNSIPADLWGKNLRISAGKSLEGIPEGTNFA